MRTPAAQVSLAKSRSCRRCYRLDLRGCLAVARLHLASLDRQAQPVADEEPDIRSPPLEVSGGGHGADFSVTLRQVVVRNTGPQMVGRVEVHVQRRKEHPLDGI